MCPWKSTKSGTLLLEKGKILVLNCASSKIVALFSFKNLQWKRDKVFISRNLFNILRPYLLGNSSLNYFCLSWQYKSNIFSHLYKPLTELTLKTMPLFRFLFDRIFQSYIARKTNMSLFEIFGIKQVFHKTITLEKTSKF